ncbi:MAG: hypothetical protein ACYDB5_10535 [bacterium]
MNKNNKVADSLILIDEMLKNEKNNKQTISEAMDVYKKTLKVIEEYDPSLVRKELWPKKYLPTATFNNVSHV